MLSHDVSGPSLLLYPLPTVPPNKDNPTIRSRRLYECALLLTSNPYCMAINILEKWYTLKAIISISPRGIPRHFSTEASLVVC